MSRELHFNLWYALIAIAAVLAIQDYLAARAGVETIPYSQFESALKAGEIADVTVSDTRIEGTYKKPGANGQSRRFTTVRVSPDLAKNLSDAKVTFSGEPAPGLFERMLGWLLPVALFLGLWMYLSQRMLQGRGGVMAIGKSKAKLFMEKSIATTFDDVAGVDEAKEELREIIAFLKDPKGYGRLGAHVPKGVLLVGPPGTGKTLLARAVAGEAGVPFLSISGSEFVELFVGVGAARVRDLFEQARGQAPCIIFIDELDALGRARGISPVSGGQDEKEQTLNQLLTELDGFDVSSGVVLLAATNRPEILDPALLRAGRFDRQILVDRPDKPGRIAILKVHLRKVQLDPQVAIEEIAALTTGFTGADLANLVNEAALLATRRGAPAVRQQDLNDAIERIVAGLEKKTRVLGASERRAVACHEIGHALVAMSVPGSDPVQKVSIIPRGIAALGYTIQRPTEDRFLMSRTELANKMTVLLGGRAAESLVLEDISTGAADDLAKATAIARSMVLRYGMVAELGQVSYEGDTAPMLGPGIESWQPRRYSESTAALGDQAVRALVDAAFTRARGILAARRVALERAAAELLRKETLTGAELAALLGSVPAETTPAPAPPPVEHTP
ncbi:MAG: ATP-dependent zinc metalloprotease FtsH [Rhodanobacteraceae bacterium]|nr:ATP-dependent zinc metalloprotease FtsH [Rhodanobacteraceae bacterium]